MGHNLLVSQMNIDLEEMTLTSAIEVFKELEPVMDPEHPVSITHPQMGIVKEEYIKVSGDLIKVLFKPTVPQCPMGGLIGILIRHRLQKVYPNYTIKVALIPGSHQLEAQVNDMISDDAKYKQIVQQLEARGML
jgi:metal-sulfur cluster biosynthetic enzyme